MAEVNYTHSDDMDPTYTVVLVSQFSAAFPQECAAIAAAIRARLAELQHPCAVRFD